MVKIRSFVKEDIPHIVKLHPQAFEDSNRPSKSYFEEVFFNNPWFDESMPSLVYEQSDGQITGFLGVIPRRFSFKRRIIQAAITAHFMVDPTKRHKMVGPQLFKAFLAGPQDLSLSDLVNFEARIVWHLFKGQTIWIYKLRWKRPFRSSASHHVQSILRKWKQPALSSFFCSAIDAFDEQIRKRSLRPKVPKVSEVEIDENTIVALLPEFYGKQFLRPDYDERSLRWLFKRAAAKKQPGRLHKVGVRNATGDIIGWYIYHLIPAVKARVLQLAAKQNSANDVLDSLFYHVWQNQTNFVTGRLEPPLINALVAKPGISCSFSDYWTMVHTRHKELLSVIHRGDAFLTELDGEWLVGSSGENFE